jgi:hypothetical protein
MKLLKRILGIPLALSISSGLIFLFIVVKTLNHLDDDKVSFYWIYNLGMTIICLSLFVFLSCLFTPSPKKYAGLISVLVSLALVASSLYLHFTDKYYEGINIRFFIYYGGIFSGILVGFYTSYEVFKNRGWSDPNGPNSDIELY